MSDEEEEEEAVEAPDWYDESKIVRAIYAIQGDGGHSAYGGYVQDLGDGTCRFTNPPLLGEGGPNWGDRVDLFYNPCDPYGRPMVGYRIYPEGVEPSGRSFGKEREPTEEEKDQHERDEYYREERTDETISRNYDAMFAPMEIYKAKDEGHKWMLRYFELKELVTDGGVEVPEDLHKKVQQFKLSDRAFCDSFRKQLKLDLLASLELELSDVVVTEEEVAAMVEDIQATEKKREAVAEKFAAQIAAFTEEEEEVEEEQEEDQ
jgi:hypothetical protein